MAQNLTYTQCGDYFIPDIRLAHTEAQILGKYGRMRRMFLEQNKPILFNDMILNETLFLHLWEVQQTCVKRMELLMEELLANNALLAGFLLVSATACGKQPAADAAQPVADSTQAYLDTVDVDYAYELALKLEDIRSNETLGYRTAGSDAELAGVSLLGFPAHTLPFRCGESTSLSTVSPLIVSKESFWSAVPHKKRPAVLWLLAVIHIFSPSFWRGASPFGKAPSPLLVALCYALPAR